MNTGISFLAVSKWYGQVSALTNMSFSIGPGVTGLVGQNGAGKSTLMKLAAGLLRPSLGEVMVCGREPGEVSTRRQIGLCPDIDRFYEHLTGVQFVAWMLQLCGAGRRAARSRSEQILTELGLGEPMHRAISTYSKGMRQRVKLAQAIAHDPAVLLLDEPLTGLDPVARHEVGEWIRRAGQSGRVVLVSSHVLHELQSVANSFLLVHRGRLLAEGGLNDLREQLYDRPRRLSLRSKSPRELAARLALMQGIVSIELDQEGVVVSAQSKRDLFNQITVLGAGKEGLIEEVSVLDESLEAVFSYLVGA